MQGFNGFEALNLRYRRDVPTKLGPDYMRPERTLTGTVTQTSMMKFT